MTQEKRNELIDAKIGRVQSNIDYNTIELEFAQQMNRDDQAKKYESRIAEYEHEIETLMSMKEQSHGDATSKDTSRQDG